MKDDSSGFEATERIKRNHPDIKVIMVTSMPEVSFIERARKAGVDSFWYKETGEGEFLSVIRRTMDGESLYPDSAPVVNLGNAKSTELTSRELQVLRELTTGATNEEIADRLYIDIATVKTHIRNILQKTGYPNRTSLAIEARIVGIVIPQK